VFQLGSSLREARIRRGIDLAHVAAETRIRSRYLRALEDERFEDIPGSVYAKGFLRSYADYLGLDSQLFVDEYNARFSDDDAPPPPSQLELEPRPLRSYAIAATVVLVALGALLGWMLTRSSSQPAPSREASAAAAKPPAPATPPTTPRARLQVTPAKPAAAALVLRATDGPCWLSVRRWGEHGTQLFEGVLEPGDSRRFVSGPFWVRIGAPWNIDASLAGHRLALPQTVTTVMVTRTGVRTLAG
jgi:cytoskeleton protein RodZ